MCNAICTEKWHALKLCALSALYCGSNSNLCTRQKLSSLSVLEAAMTEGIIAAFLSSLLALILSGTAHTGRGCPHIELVRD